MIRQVRVVQIGWILEVTGTDFFHEMFDHKVTATVKPRLHSDARTH